MVIQFQNGFVVVTTLSSSAHALKNKGKNYIKDVGMSLCERKKGLKVYWASKKGTTSPPPCCNKAIYMHIISCSRKMPKLSYFFLETAASCMDSRRRACFVSRQL